METAGHEKVAVLVNQAVGGAFSPPFLTAGSVDPDTKASGRSYIGPFSKHHFDPGGLATGRYHGADTIIWIVHQQCKMARNLWLADRHDNAAFEFGVATHYFIDGFICSPSVNEAAHQAADSKFGRVARSMNPPPVPAIDDRAFCSGFITVQLSGVSSRFGRTDVADLPAAYLTLVRLALAVAAPVVPTGLKELIAETQNWFAVQLDQAAIAFGAACAHEDAHLVEIVEIACSARANRGWLTWYFLALAELHREAKTGASLLAGLVTRHFTVCASRAMGHELDGYMQQQLTRMSGAADQAGTLKVEWDRDWYVTLPVTKAHGAEVRRLLDGCRSAMQNMWIRQEAKRAEGVDAWRGNWAKEELPRRWGGSFADKIGHNRGPATLLWAGLLVAGAVVCLCAISLDFGLGALLAGGPLVFVAGVAWRTSLICRRITKLLWRIGQISCPRCKQESAVEALRNEHSMACPRCGHPTVPIQTRPEQVG